MITNKKAVFTALLLVFFSIFLPCTLSSQTRVVNVGYFKFNNFNVLKDGGKRSGYGYDYLQYLSYYNNWTYNYIGYEKSWQESLEMLKNGKIDILGLIKKTREREQDFDFSDLPMGEKNYVIATSLYNKNLYKNDLKSLNGTTIGILEGDSIQDVFEDFSKEHSIEYTPHIFKGFDATTLMKQAIKDGTVDAILLTDITDLNEFKILYSLESVPIYLAVKKGNTTLLNELNVSMKELYQNNPTLIKSLKAVYYGGENHRQFEITKKEKKAIEDEKKPLLFLTASDNKPYSWVENNKIKGIFPDTVQKLSEITGIPITLKAARADSLYQRIDGDCIIGVPFDIYEAEKHRYKLSSIFCRYNLAQITLKEKKNEELPAGITTGQQDIKNFLENNKIPFYTFNDINGCLAALSRGKISKIYTTSTHAQMLVNQKVLPDIQMIIEKDKIANIAIAFSAEKNYTLLSVINKCIENDLKHYDNEITPIYIQESIKETSFLDFWRDNKTTIIIVLFLLTLGIVILIFVQNKYTLKIVAKNKELEKLATERESAQLCAEEEAAKAEEQASKAEEETKKAETAIAKAKKALSVKNEFLSRMSHDMRTPLTAVIGLANFGLENEETDKTPEYFDQIIKNSSYLLKLLNDILDFQKMQNQHIDLYPKTSNLQQVISNIDSIVSYSMFKKKMKFSVHKNIGNTPIYANIDEKRFEQIHVNLLNNALNYTPKGGTIKWSVRIEHSNSDSLLIVSTISDNGVGMSNEFQKNMYEPFNQEKNALSIDSDGSGLGLSIVHGIVKSLHGKIDCTSSIGRGTTFTITVKVPASKPKEISNYCLSKDTEINTSNLNGKHILICEDVEINAQIIAKLLVKKGCKCTIAKNGKIGIDIVRNKEKGPLHGIIMDIKMPVMDGFEASREIRTFDKSIPIVALSADITKQDIILSKNVGMNGYLQKPIDVDTLYKTLNSLL